MAIRVEPASVAARSLQQVGVALHTTKRLFNAELAILDDRGLPRAYLAEAIPQLDTDTWRVLPDGRMETTYRLKPDVTWHDGARLTAEDFIFSWRVYSTPDFGVAASPPINLIQDVVAADPRTLVIHWRAPYPGADALVEDQFPPLPRHILEGSFDRERPDSFTALPYWTRDYVGLGPFHLDRWEPGAFIEAAGFAGHVLGRPRIERLKIVFIGDANTALANLVAGEVHLSADLAIGFRQGVTLKREWEPRNAGTVLLHPNQWRSTRFQLRPDIANPRGILDVRVRRALAHALDKQAVLDATYEGEGIIGDIMIPPMADYYPAIDRAIVKYPYDLRRSEQLMNEAGFRKGQDGFFASGDGRFAPELKTNASAEFEAEMSVLAAGWRLGGFDIQEAVLPTAQAQDPQARASFASMFTHNTGLGEPAMIDQITARIPRPENRWAGGNRGGWSNAEYDRLVEAFNTTLDRNERAKQAAQLTRIYSEELPSITLLFAIQPMAHVAALRGPGLVAPGAVMGWNAHEWEFR